MTTTTSSPPCDFTRDDERRRNALLAKQQQRVPSASSSTVSPAAEVSPPPLDAVASAFGSPGETPADGDRTSSSSLARDGGGVIPYPEAPDAGGSGLLTSDEVRELDALNVKYETFLRQGEERLRLGRDSRAAAVEESDESTNSGGWAAWRKTLSHVATGFAGATYFYGSLLATAAPGIVGRRTNLTPDFLHWNFITDFVILGALPVVTEVAGSGNHLVKLRQQLAERTPPRRIGLVVSALTEEEMNGFGLGVVQFAKPSHWRAELGVEQFVMVPMTDGDADVTFDVVLNIIRLMRDCEIRDEITYVHCKAGKGRSWTVVMCYLTVMSRLSFDDAAQLVVRQRAQVNPSTAQVQFVRDFIARFGGSV